VSGACGVPPAALTDAAGGCDLRAARAVFRPLGSPIELATGGRDGQAVAHDQLE
jgi:hypothetical protein